MKKIYNQAQIDCTMHAVSSSTVSELVPISILSPSVQMHQIVTLRHGSCSLILNYKLILTNKGDAPCISLILENLLPFDLYLIPNSLTLNSQLITLTTHSKLTITTPLLLGERLFIEFEAAPFDALPKQLASPVNLTYFFKVDNVLRSLQTSSTSLVLLTTIIATIAFTEEINLSPRDIPLNTCCSITSCITDTPVYSPTCHALWVPYTLTIDYMNACCDLMTFSYPNYACIFCSTYDPSSMHISLNVEGPPCIRDSGYTLYVPLSLTVSGLN